MGSYLKIKKRKIILAFLLIFNQLMLSSFAFNNRKLDLIESDEEVHHDDKYFSTLLSVIEKFPELKIKTMELVANLARQGMPSSLHGLVC